MILSWRRRKALRRANYEKGDVNLDVEVVIPTYFRCPISLDLMKDPVTLSTGITYDRDSIEKWIEAGNQTCPVTNQVLTSFDRVPNHSIRKMIQDWCVENRSYGIERIATPRIPVTASEVSNVCRRVMDATQRGDEKKCGELVGKIKNWGKESERNKRFVAENGVGYVLSISFETFARISMEKHADLLAEILSVLVWMFPLGVEGQAKLGSKSSLEAMIWFLKSGDLSARQNAILVVKELLCLDQKHLNVLADLEGIVPALVCLIKEPICPTATKSALMVIFHMISPSEINENLAATFVEMGLVSLIMEILIDGDKGICEKALGVLEHICDCEEGREEAYKNALMVPLLIKKILRVSSLVSDFAVSILWKLCKNDKREEEGRVTVEALQMGGFQKLLLLLQVGCGESTKEKVTELLKLMNLWRTRLHCVDSSMDFKYLNKPY